VARKRRASDSQFDRFALTRATPGARPSGHPAVRARSGARSRYLRPNGTIAPRVVSPNRRKYVPVRAEVSKHESARHPQPCTIRAEVSKHRCDGLSAQVLGSGPMHNAELPSSLPRSALPFPAAPTFDLPLRTQRFFAFREFLRPDKRYGSASRCVAARPVRLMWCQANRKIIRMADVVRVVGASQHVCVKAHT